MADIISDDIGSFPLPEGVKREGLEGEEFEEVVRGIMQRKISAGIQRPTYPQVKDMISQFFSSIEESQGGEGVWLINEEDAKIPEIEIIDDIAKEHYERTSQPLELRVCVTGPLELYLEKVGNQVQGDLLMNLAESVSRFVKNSLVDKEYMKTKTVSIDEPSLGLNPNIVAEQEDLVKALDLAVKPAKGLDIQVHLHAPNSADLIYETENIGIIGIETAEEPKFLDDIDKDDLEQHDKFLRVGIARSNIFGIAADYKERKGIDVWKEKNFGAMVNEMENVNIMKKRLGNSLKIFDDRIKYAGPDCGLSAWPSQDSAELLLRNAAVVVEEFNKK